MGTRWLDVDAPERGSLTITITACLDTADNVISSMPDSNWTLTNIAGEVVNSRDSVAFTLSYPIKIFLTNLDLGLVNRNDKTRVVTIKGTYTDTNGANASYNEEIKFNINPQIAAADVAASALLLGSSLSAEITAARGGEANLDTRLDTMTTATTTAQAEVTAARAGIGSGTQATLLERLDAMEGWIDVSRQPFQVSTARTATQNATGFQDAFTYAASSGKPIFIPAGTYNVDPLDASTLGHKALIHGAGMRNTILVNADVAGASLITFDSQHAVALKHLGLQGNASSGHGIEFKRTSFSCWNALVQHCWIYKHGGSGLYADNLFSSAIRDCYFGGDTGFGNADHQLWWVTGGTSDVVEGCWFRDIPDTKFGIVSTSNINFAVRTCNFSGDTVGVTWNGILLKSTKQYEISLCNFENDVNCTLGAGIQLGDATPAWWGNGRITFSTFTVGTGTITDQILLARSSLGAANVLVVEGGQTVDMGNITQGYVIGIPYATPQNDADARYIGMGMTPLAGVPTILGSGQVVRWVSGATKRTYQIGVNAAGAVVADQVT